MVTCYGKPLRDKNFVDRRRYLEDEVFKPRKHWAAEKKAEHLLRPPSDMRGPWLQNKRPPMVSELFPAFVCIAAHSRSAQRLFDE